MLAAYASSQSRPINLSQLLSFGRPLQPASVLQSVQYVLAEIPRRLAHRVQTIEGLPFIVGTNPYVANVLAAYKESFLSLATHPPVTTLEDNAVFAEHLEELVDRHADDIPAMAKGFQESSKYMSPAQMSDFLDGAFRSRISVRLLAEQHISLSRALNDPSVDKSHVGVVDVRCSPAKMVRMCASFVSELCEATLGSTPSVHIDGFADATFAYIPVHVEYILTEILKNSFRATVEHHQHHHHGHLPPISITLSPPPRTGHEPGKPSPKFFSIRIRDQGGGVAPANMAHIFSYAFTTVGRKVGEVFDETEGGPYAAQHVSGGGAIGEGAGDLFGEVTRKGVQTGLGTLSGLGYGLPLARLYANYFGGSLELVSLEGWGSDVFVKLRCLDEAGDAAI